VLALVNFSMREGVAAGRGKGAKQVTKPVQVMMRSDASNQYPF
jgi:hypothetical protein